MAEERDASNTVTRRFYAEGEQISGGIYYYTRDHLGSVREMSGVAGAIRAQCDYNAFGVRTKVQGDLEASFGFAGYYFHAPSGLNLALYRAYDSTSNRWLNRDPLKDAETAQGPNLYAYVNGNPTNQVDPSGEGGEYPGGHHYVPGPIRNDPSVSPAARQVWSSSTLDPIVRPHYYDAAHRGYSAAVTDLYQGWLTSINKSPGQLTAEDAASFVKLINSSSVAPISGYLGNIRLSLGNLFSFAPLLDILHMWVQGSQFDDFMREHSDEPYFLFDDGEFIINPYYGRCNKS